MNIFWDPGWKYLLGGSAILRNNDKQGTAKSKRSKGQTKGKTKVIRVQFQGKGNEEHWTIGSFELT